MTTTPPVSNIYTPPSPLHGAKHDTYGPYLTRKSTRSSFRIAKTPPPLSASPEQGVGSSSKAPSSKRRMPAHDSKEVFSPPSSKQSSPKKRNTSKRSQKPDLVEFANNSDDGDSAVEVSEGAARNLKFMLSHPTKNGSTLGVGMLPTPVKTPRKRPDKSHPGPNPTARVLFQDRPGNVEEAMPSPKKQSRKHTALSLGSFAEEVDEMDGDQIQIFTDSKERVPELDESVDNPFYNRGGEVEQRQPSTKRSNKRRKTRRSESEDELMKRDDGMVYVFRGKKIFRKFDDSEASDDPLAEHDSDQESEIASHLEASKSDRPHHRPMTRSSIKPRLLFPSADQKQPRHQRRDPSKQANKAKEAIEAIEESDVDESNEEEALTDIDELAQPLSTDGNHNEDSTMVDAADVLLPVSPVTPADQNFTTTSPPATIRHTRATAKKATVESPSSATELEKLTPPMPKRGKKSSPFDGWQRTKPGLGDTHKKREGDEIEKNGGTISKRTRSGAT
ncbi:MAG: hypothetical protein M1837_003403 [Sclerophora amabilis]|nr:MAG: hypothetical protein M1837_003403 [Sclerophora amabilis]